MKLTEFKTENLGRGRANIIFDEPITEEDGYDLSLFVEFFNTKQNKKKVLIDYSLRPLQIKGLQIHKQTWARFLNTVNKESAKTWYSQVRDLPIRTLEEFEQFLEFYKKAKILRG